MKGQASACTLKSVTMDCSADPMCSAFAMCAVCCATQQKPC
jgi:hypothetical protein